MPIFQKSILNKYLKNLDIDKVNLAFKQFQLFYGDKLRLFDIVHLKEENYQEGFLREVFVQSLGYTIRPDLNYNLTTEYKNQTDSKKADGAIIINNSAIGVIELKSAKTFNLDTIKNQAFNYKHNQPDCKYVITSNFHYLRFYIDNSAEYEEFDLFEITEKEFQYFYLILSYDSIFNDIPLKMKDETKFHEESISDKFYRDYKAFKDKVFENFVINNPQYDKLIWFKKSQKLLDRFIFVWFAEDCGLVAPNSIQKIIDQYNQYIKLDDYKTLYSRFQLLFHYLDKGYKSKVNKDVYRPPYNGGLFKYDEIIDSEEIKLDDNILLEFCPKISTYDFNTEIDVNILGHIFEHSLNEIEEITAELKGETIEKSKTKRKKDGIFYTPKYITNYIVENTIGKLCKEKQTELQILDIELNETYNKNNKITKQGKELYQILQNYKNWLLTLKILDPACGSGAFLNSALDFLISEHQRIDDLISDLTGAKIGLYDIDKTILEKNIYGVDINEESVEIAKLSLWLRTAIKDRPLSDLNNNIKCGNSLIDNKEIVGEKAFNWNLEFAEIMQNGGFDIVIGNPPYVFTRDRISETEKNYYIANFHTSKYQLNLYVIFIEKSYQLLKNSGNFGFIVPNAWLMISSAEKLREFLLTQTKISNIVNFTGEIFSNAGVEPVILCFTKENKENYLINILNNELDEFFISYQINSSEFFKNPQKEFKVFLDSESKNIINKIQKNSIILDKVATVKAGLKAYEKGKGKPSQTPYHLMKKPFDFKYKYDENTHKYLEGRDVLRYSINWTDNWLQYSEQLAAPRTFDIFTGEKIIIREIAGKYPNSIMAVYSNEIYLFNMSNIAVVKKEGSHLDLRYITALLNSRLMSFYFMKNTAKSVRDLFPKLILNDLRIFPIKEISQTEQTVFIEKVDKIQNLYKEINLEKSNFINSLKEDKKPKQINSKIENFQKIDFDEFKLELAKQNVKFSLGEDNNQWRNYFSTTKEKIINLQNAINKTDTEINRMVYELYELSEEDIALVEKKDEV